MALTPSVRGRDPFQQLASLTEELWSPFLSERPMKFFENGEEGWTPAVDIREDTKQFVVTADIPGVDPKNVEITMDNGALTIKGERSSERTEDKKGYHCVERAYGTFVRRIAFPDTVDVEAIKASGKNGVLEITIPKKPNAQPRRVTVQ